MAKKAVDAMSKVSGTHYEVGTSSTIGASTSGRLFTDLVLKSGYKRTKVCFPFSSMDTHTHRTLIMSVHQLNMDQTLCSFFQYFLLLDIKPTDLKKINCLLILSTYRLIGIGTYYEQNFPSQAASWQPHITIKIEIIRSVISFNGAPMRNHYFAQRIKANLLEITKNQSK